MADHGHVLCNEKKAHVHAASLSFFQQNNNYDTTDIAQFFFNEWIIELVWETIKNSVLDYFICWCFTTHPAL